MRLLRRCALALRTALAVLVLLGGSVAAREDDSPDARLARLLEEARDAADTAACSSPDTDRLVRIFCAGHIRVGIREYYPLFATRVGNVRDGYEVDVAQALAKKLGVDVEFLRVNAASRIPLLAEDRIDLIIATMGHNTQRDTQVRFIRPHYYRSETIVVGPKPLAITGWDDIPGRTVCVTIGNGSNADLVAHDARLLLFDEAGVLPDRLLDGTCTLAAQDDSFFADAFTEPGFAARFDTKFGFAQVPWGMAVAREHSDRLATALDLISQIFHRDGVFLEIARKHHIATGFLQEQRKLWSSPTCNTATGFTNRACLLPAFDAELEPTPFAGAVTDFEDWFSALTGVELSLPMLKTMPAWSLFLSGIANTLVLIAGALSGTLLFALLIGLALSSTHRLPRWLARGLVVVLQSSPIVLTLVVASAVTHALLPYSAATALGAAIVALGLVNGSNAGQAIGEAMASLRAEEAASGRHVDQLFVRAVGRAATQIVAFLINAAKGTPIASFIGAPELLSALTDITSFSSGRATTYTLLLVFYTLVVIVVVALCRRLQVALEGRQVPAR
ncbi:ABC-type amino acid transport substrate-binding protein [Enhydrobacter aerosaccus]|uniref:ABC-type amino acid transport substrate-binding protein n=1 Tax=Enhydrobacter aerosaccus TaxID=225324 RepID=A0A1T4T1C6_9HYPH|nr:transporter substrate-binding domain-containing protein [Enhydrobacter aerosaccus]SKA34255.1 ABC-type amino acid transport substrate-binding protein [Enhydrobacter aerosaccus]